MYNANILKNGRYLQKEVAVGNRKLYFSLIYLFFIYSIFYTLSLASDFEAGGNIYFREGNSGYLKFDVSLPEGFNHYATEVYALPLDKKVSHLMVSYPQKLEVVSKNRHYSYSEKIPPGLENETKRWEEVCKQWDKQSGDIYSKQRFIESLKEQGKAKEKTEEERELLEKLMLKENESLLVTYKTAVNQINLILEVGDDWFKKFESLPSPKDGYWKAQQINAYDIRVMSDVIRLANTLKGLPGLIDEEKKKIEGEIKEFEKRLKVIKERETQYWQTRGDWQEKRQESELIKIKDTATHYEKATVVGQFIGEGPAEVRLVTLSRGADPKTVKEVARIKLNLPSEQGGDKTIKDYWQKALTERYRHILSLGSDPFFAYFLPRPESRFMPDASLYAMVSGALAMQETLQLWVTQEADTGERNVPINELQPPKLNVHDFQKLREGRKSEFSEIANLIPDDFLYVQFYSTDKVVRFSDSVNEFMQGFLQGRGITGRDYDLVKRMLGQVGLAIPDFVKSGADNIVGEVCIGISDPQVRDGAGFILAMKVINPTAYNLLEKASLFLKGKDCKTGKDQCEGKEYLWTVSDDGSVKSYRTDVMGYRVLTNSRQAMEKVIRCSLDKETSLVDSQDFLYMRSIFPGRDKDEDGFVYLSDAFVNKLLSPGWRIANARRKVCAGRLILLRTLSQIYKMKYGNDAAGLSDLELNQTLLCPEGGNLSLVNGIPACSVHGRIGNLTPIDELFPEKATKKEKESFENFVTNYTRIWRQYIDPIGITFRMNEEGIQARTCILPLVENSAYQSVYQFFSGEPMTFNTNYQSQTTVAGIQTRMNPKVLHQFCEPWERGARESFFSMLTPEEANLEWLGDSATLAFHDSELLFSYDFSGIEGQMFGGGGTFMLIGSLIASALNMPVSFHLDVKDSDTANRFIQKWIDFSKEKLFAETLRRAGGERWFEISNYSTKLQGQDVLVIDFLLYVIRFRLFYTILPNRIVFATRPEVIEDIIKSRDFTSSSSKDSQGHLALRIHGEAFNRITRDYEMNWQEKVRESCLANLATTQALFLTGIAGPESLDEITMKNYGYRLVCPAGGRYQWDSIRSEAFCSLHGYAGNQKQSVDALNRGAAERFVENWKGLKCVLTFTPEGIMTDVKLAPCRKDSSDKGRDRSHF